GPRAPPPRRASSSPPGPGPGPAPPRLWTGPGRPGAPGGAGRPCPPGPWSPCSREHRFVVGELGDLHPLTGRSEGRGSIRDRRVAGPVVPPRFPTGLGGALRAPFDGRILKDGH